MQSRGLPYENYQLAYTENSFSDLLEDIFTGPLGPLVNGIDMLAGQFEQIGSDWWIRSGVIEYITGAEDVDDAKARFYTPLSYTNQYGSKTTVEFDSKYLYIQKTIDALDNESSVVTFDYRTLTPVKMMDPNDNLSEVLLDELGLPKAMAVYGKGGEADDLSGLITQAAVDADQANIDSYFALANAVPTVYADLQDAANELLQGATARFVYNFNVQPAVISTILREDFLAVSSNSPLQLSFEYSDGFNRVAMKKCRQSRAPQAM